MSMSTITYDKKREVTIPEGYDIIKSIHGEKVANEWKLNYDFAKTKLYIQDLIMDAFMWSRTLQGADYWLKIHQFHMDVLGKMIKSNPVEAKPAPTPTPPPLGYLEEIEEKKRKDSELRDEYKKKQEKALKLASDAKKKLAARLSELVVEFGGVDE